MTTPRPRACTLAVGAVLCVLLALLLPGSAAADVTVAASRAESGARNVTVTFRVTNPDPAVPTTRLEVFLPTARPLLGVRPIAPGGWTARVTTAPPSVAATVDGGPVPEVATAVTWEGGAVPADDYTAFPIDVDRLPDGAGPLRFRVVRSFADGDTEEWSDLVPYGAPAPEHPALVVAYSTPAAAPVEPHRHGGPAAQGPAASDPVAAHHHGGGGADVGALPAGERAVGRFVALAGAALALVVIIANALGRWQRLRMTKLIVRDRNAPDQAERFPGRSS
jgi:uncharacterized protein YcnI